MQKTRKTPEGHAVVLTDSAQQARHIQTMEPVIGICIPGSVNQSWTGISFLAEDWNSVDEEYLELAWCRWHHMPRTLLNSDNIKNESKSSNIKWKIREAAIKDASLFLDLYEDEQVKKFLEYPLSEETKCIEDWKAWIESLHRYIYPSEEPAMWVLAGENDEMLGRIGLEYRDENGFPAGYYLGYALLPKWRKKGLAAKAASQLVEYCMEYWQLEQIYLLCSSENIASIKTAIDAGFKLTDFPNASLYTKDIIEHRLNLSACVGTGKLLLFTRETL